MNNNNLSMYDYLKLATCKNNRIVPGRAAKGKGKGKDEGKGKGKGKSKHKDRDRFDIPELFLTLCQIARTRTCRIQGISNSLIFWEYDLYCTSNFPVGMAACKNINESL
jgi:hypothetical protein